MRDKDKDRQIDRPRGRQAVKPRYMWTKNRQKERHQRERDLSILAYFCGDTEKGVCL